MKTSKYYSFKTNIAPRLHNLIENKINRYLTFLRTLRSASNNIITAIILRFTASHSYSFSLTMLIPASRDIWSWSEAAWYTRRCKLFSMQTAIKIHAVNIFTIIFISHALRSKNVKKKMKISYANLLVADDVNRKLAPTITIENDEFYLLRKYKKKLWNFYRSQKKSQIANALFDWKCPNVTTSNSCFSEVLKILNTLEEVIGF